tara:strand:- start:566 stop:739 length:174 start_codon:yes stop_codon:yes gene_type:complete
MESKDYDFKDLLIAIAITSATLIYSFNQDAKSNQAKDQNTSASSDQVENTRGISSID